jgi:hypothetical protein
VGPRGRKMHLAKRGCLEPRAMPSGPYGVSQKSSPTGAHAAHHVPVCRPPRAARRRGGAVCLSPRRRLARCLLATSPPSQRSTAQAPTEPEKVSRPRPPPRHSRRSAAGAGEQRGRAAAEWRGRGCGGARSSRPERRPLQGPCPGLRAPGVRRRAAARLGGAAPGACWATAYGSVVGLVVTTAGRRTPSGGKCVQSTHAV